MRSPGHPVDRDIGTGAAIIVQRSVRHVFYEGDLPFAMMRREGLTGYFARYYAVLNIVRTARLFPNSST
jgi:hypothetical protein